MSVQTSHPLPHGGISPNGPLSQAHSVPPSHEMASHAAQPASGTTANTETKFLPLHVFNHWVMNLMRNSVSRLTPLQEWRQRSKSRPEKTRRGSTISAHDAIDPVAGRARTANVSLTLNLLRDNSSDDQRSKVEEELKNRKLNPNQRLQVYIKAAENVDRAGFSPEDADRIKQALKKSVQDIQLKNRHELRQSMHNPEKLREAMEAIGWPIEKLMAVTRRELRNHPGPDYPNTEMHRIDVPFQGLSLLNVGMEIGGPEHCWKVVMTIRLAWKSGY